MEPTEVDFDLFRGGNSVVIETVDGLRVGIFLGVMEFGVALKLTLKTEMQVKPVTEAMVASVYDDIASLTIDDLKVLAADEEIKLSGAKRKSDMVQIIVEAIIEQMEHNAEEIETVIEYAVPVTSFTNWSEIKNIYDGNEWGQNQEVLHFRNSVPDGLSDDQADS